MYKTTRSRARAHGIVLCWLLLSAATACHAMKIIDDIPFANTGKRDLLLDLYLPETRVTPKLVVWLHGGAWQFGNKSKPELIKLVDRGFALASIGFRNSGEAIFPAQLYDIKAAVRFLRANAKRYGFDADHIAIAGCSSGGHLAAVAGTSNGNAELEGTLGNYLGTSSAVQAIVDYSGPANLNTILAQSTPHGVSVREPALNTLFGKPAGSPAIQHLTDLASPALQVNGKAPPLFLIHGVQDNQVPINQALELEKAYENAGRVVQTEWMVDGGHCDPRFFSAPLIDKAAEFLNRVL